MLSLTRSSVHWAGSNQVANDFHSFPCGWRLKVLYAALVHCKISLLQLWSILWGNTLKLCKYLVSHHTLNAFVYVRKGSSCDSLSKPASVPFWQILWILWAFVGTRNIPGSSCYFLPQNQPVLQGSQWFWWRRLFRNQDPAAEDAQSCWGVAAARPPQAHPERGSVCAGTCVYMCTLFMLTWATEATCSQST